MELSPLCRGTTALEGYALRGRSCADLPDCGSALRAEERFVAALDWFQFGILEARGASAVSDRFIDEGYSVQEVFPVGRMSLPESVSWRVNLDKRYPECCTYETQVYLPCLLLANVYRCER